MTELSESEEKYLNRVTDKLAVLQTSVGQSTTQHATETATKAIRHIEKHFPRWNSLKGQQTAHLESIFGSYGAAPSSRIRDDLRNDLNLIYYHWGRAFEREGKISEAIEIYKDGHQRWLQLEEAYGAEFIRDSDNSLKRLLVLTEKEKRLSECLHYCELARDDKRKRRVLRKIQKC